MTGWAAVATVVGLMAVATVGFNASLWLRHKSLAAARGGWSEDDFGAAMAGIGVSAQTAAAVRAALSGYYMAGLAPRPDDSFEDVLRVNAEERDELVNDALNRAEAPPLRPGEDVAAIATVADLALWLERRSRLP